MKLPRVKILATLLFSSHKSGNVSHSPCPSLIFQSNKYLENWLLQKDRRMTDSDNHSQLLADITIVINKKIAFFVSNISTLFYRSANLTDSKRNNQYTNLIVCTFPRNWHNACAPSELYLLILLTFLIDSIKYIVNKKKRAHKKHRARNSLKPRRKLACVVVAVAIQSHKH